jgi:hypothetical protein
MLRLPYFIEVQLPGAREVISLMHWLPFTLRKVRSIEKSSDFIRN